MYTLRVFIILCLFMTNASALGKKDTLGTMNGGVHLTLFNIFSCSDESPCYSYLSYQYNLASFLPNYEKWNFLTLNAVLGIIIEHSNSRNNKELSLQSLSISSYKPYIGASATFYFNLTRRFRPHIYSGAYYLITQKEPIQFYGGVGLSFDLLESNFSGKINSEYGIKDAGFFAEFRQIPQSTPNVRFLAGIFVNF